MLESEIMGMGKQRWGVMIEFCGGRGAKHSKSMNAMPLRG